MVRIPMLASLLLVFGAAATLQAYPDRSAGTIPLTIQPKAVRIGPTGRFLYVIDAAAARYSVVDTLFFAESSTVALDAVPADLALGADGSTLYVVTATADEVKVFDLADPSAPVAKDDISLGSSGATFDRILVAGSGSNEVLILGDDENQKIYVYELTDARLRSNGTTDKIPIDVVPISAKLDTLRSRVIVLSADGVLWPYSYASLGQLGNSLDLGAESSTQDFTHLQIGLFGSGSYGFAANRASPGEVFVVNMASSNDTLTFLDNDLSSGTIDPLTVGEGPSGSLVAQISRPSGDATGSATYLYSANRTDGTLSVVNVPDIGNVATPIATVTAVPDVPPDGMAASSAEENYIYALNQTGASMTVVTDQPWLTVSNVPTDPVASSEATVTLRSSADGSYSLVLYTAATTAAVSSTGGTVLVTGTLTADTDTDVTFSTADLAEGENILAVFQSSVLKNGRTAFRMTRDLPPATPEGFKLSFGNEKIIAEWKRGSEEDLDHYLVYFGTDADATSGVGSLVSPATVALPGSGNLKTILEPVPNGTTVYVKVVAVDQTGNTSDPTAILSETAEETVGLLALSGETGGCASAGAPWLFAFVLALCLILRRRAVLPAILWFAIVPWGRASAEPMGTREGSAPLLSSVEFRVSWWLPASATVRQFYGNGGNEIYSLRYGLVWWRLDFGVDAGFLRESAAMTGVTTGRKSGESTSLTMVPFGFSVQGNLQFEDDPVIVPFARIGYEAVYFSIDEPAQSVDGFKHTSDFGAGIRLHLDRLGSGADLQDLMGIRHFFLEGVATYRLQWSGGLNLGGWMFAPGIGFEF